MTDLPQDSVLLLLKKAGLATAMRSLSRLSGGRNNRAYRLETNDGPVLLKHYHRGGEWDRLAAESSFLRFCAGRGIDCVPRLLAEDPDNALALHSWLEGERLAADAITGRDIGAAAAFLRDLGQASRAVDLARISPARDAALCLEDFFRSPRERLAQLHAALLVHSDQRIALKVLAFYEKELFPAWEKASAAAYVRLAGENFSLPFADGALLVSPSDIGFHNALRLKNGELAFFDFEYAGRDSRVKAAGDFLCQADYLLPVEAVDTLVEPDSIRAVNALLPLFRIKFCCIGLNDFKKIDADRRGFAETGKEEVRLRGQLRKARLQCRQYNT